jgi:hypothetical protein
MGKGFSPQAKKAMFEEEPFEDHPSPSQVIGKHSRKEPQSATVALHRPGDSLFRFVCGAGEDVGRQHLMHVASGDAWGSKECHCLQCGLIRVDSLIHQMLLREPQQAPIRIVLLDLDNYGFPQLFASLAGGEKKASQLPSDKKRQAKRSRNLDSAACCSGGDAESLTHGGVFVWCFYSSCFARYFNVDPREAILGSRSGETGCNHDDDDVKFWQRPPSGKSIWAHLRAAGSAYFTPCAAHKQAADGAILQVFAAARGIRPVVLVSGDKDLCRTAREMTAGEPLARVVEINELPGMHRSGTAVFRHICEVALSLVH